MILQGVGHPISCLGVCYVNDPQKGGCTTHAPALDLTTSLRGDFDFWQLCRILPTRWAPRRLRGGGGGAMPSKPGRFPHPSRASPCSSPDVGGRGGGATLHHGQLHGADRHCSGTAQGDSCNHPPPWIRPRFVAMMVLLITPPHTTACKQLLWNNPHTHNTRASRGGGGARGASQLR